MSVETQLFVAIITAIGGVVVAVVGLAGRNKETTAAETTTLITGQAERIDRLEERLDKVENELKTTRYDLWRYQTHASALRQALTKALVWIGEAVEWINGPRATDPPTPPNSDAWQTLIESHPVPTTGAVDPT